MHLIIIILLYFYSSPLKAQAYISDLEKTQIEKLSDLASHMPTHADYIRKKGHYFGIDLDLQRAFENNSSTTLEQLAPIGGIIPSLWLGYNKSKRKSQHSFSIAGVPLVEVLGWRVRNLKFFYNYMRGFRGRSKKNISFGIYLDQLIVERAEVIATTSYQAKYSSQVAGIQIGSAHLIHKSSRSNFRHYIGGHFSYYQRFINRNAIADYDELKDSSAQTTADLRYSFCGEKNCWTNGLEYTSSIGGKFISNFSLRF